MKQIQELLNTPSSQNNLQQGKQNQDAVHLLFVSPFVNSNGYYRMLLPYLELGATKEYETRVTSVRKWDFTKTYTITEDSFKEEDIQWADYIIFSMLIENYTYVFQALKVINPEVLLVMDIERQIHNIPKAHADYTEFPKEKQEQLLKNILFMDIITTPIQHLCQIYRDWLFWDPKVTKEIEVYCIPSLLSKIGYETLVPVSKPKDGVVRIGMVGSVRSVADFRFFLPVFKNIKETYKDKVEIIIFGWDGKNPSGYKPLKEVPITFYKSVHFLKYYQKLADMHLDVMLIPMRSMYYYHYASTIKYIEAAALGIPVIALRCSSYAQIIENDTNGILAWRAPEWEEKLRLLIDSPEYRQKLGENAKKSVWKKHAYTEKNLHIFRQIFI